MFHKEVYEKFKEKFPEKASYLKEWFPNGRNSVRVRFNSGSDFVFTYNSEDDWCYETVDSYIKKLKGGRTMNVGLHDNINKDE